MRDGPLRRGLKAVVRWHNSLELGLARALARRRGQRPWDLGGECRSCARCCEEPTIAVGRLLWYSPLLRSTFLWWQERVNGFVLRGRDVASRSFRFECSHFDPATRRCDSYESRPLMCRDYPRLLLWQPAPELFPECGYRAVAPNAEGLLRALDAQPLSPEQRARLVRGLRLERNPPPAPRSPRP